MVTREAEATDYAISQPDAVSSQVLNTAPDKGEDEQAQLPAAREGSPPANSTGRNMFSLPVDSRGNSAIGSQSQNDITQHRPTVPDQERHSSSASVAQEEAKPNENEAGSGQIISIYAPNTMMETNNSSKPSAKNSPKRSR